MAPAQGELSGGAWGEWRPLVGAAAGASLGRPRGDGLQVGVARVIGVGGEEEEAAEAQRAAARGVAPRQRVQLQPLQQPDDVWRRGELLCDGARLLRRQLLAEEALEAPERLRAQRLGLAGAKRQVMHGPRSVPAPRRHPSLTPREPPGGAAPAALCQALGRLR